MWQIGYLISVEKLLEFLVFNLQIGDVAYHDFPGNKMDEDVKDSLINSFGSASQVTGLSCLTH